MNCIWMPPLHRLRSMVASLLLLAPLLTLLPMSAGCFNDEGGANGDNSGGAGGEVVVGENDGHSPRWLAWVDEGGDRGTVYFSEETAEGGAIVRLHLGTNSATPTSLVSVTNGLPPSEVAAHGSVVAWIEATETSGSVRCTSSTDPGEGADAGTDEGARSVTTVVEGVGKLQGLAVGQDHLFYGDPEGNTIWAAPIESGNGAADEIQVGEPFELVGDVGAVVALALDGDHLYFLQAFDSPHGAIRRVRISGLPANQPPVEEVVIGLGAPWDLAFIDDQVCWRELQGGLLRCTEKAGGLPRLLAAGHSYLPLARPTLAAQMSGADGAGVQVIYYATRHEIRRVSLAANGTQDVVVVSTGDHRMVYSFVVIDGELFWSDGSRLRKLVLANLNLDNGGENNGSLPPGPGCPSIYDGSYMGMFHYQYETGEGENRQVVNDSFSLTLTFRCVTTIEDSTVLNITSATATHPFFGCQVGACTPKFGSTAAFPPEAPTTPVSNVSKNGHGLVILFPNGTSLSTNNLAGALSISTGGRTITNSLAPEIQHSTWVANPGFPPERPPTGPVTKYESWILNASAL